VVSHADAQVKLFLLAHLANRYGHRRRSMTPVSTTSPTQPKSRTLTRLLAATAAALLLGGAIVPIVSAQTPTMIVLRAMPKDTKRGETFTPQPPLAQADIAEIHLNGKPVQITAVDPLLKGPHTLQLLILLDSMQMIGGNGQFDAIRKFIADMPSNVEIGVGWMIQSQVKMVQPFTTDRAAAGKVLIQKTREEADNPKSDNGNPYSCLRWIAAHWPNPDPAKLRALIMFTDGIIRNNAQPQGGDQLNPDVDGASLLLQKSGIVPYPFFYLDFPIVDANRNEGGQLEGQTNFSQLTADTGGEALYEGQFSPGTFDPLLNKFYSVLQSEAVVTVVAPAKPGKQMRLDVKSAKDDIKIDGPDQVTVGNVLGK
jgi:hypothetical protein